MATPSAMLNTFSHTETVGFRETMSDISAYNLYYSSPKIQIRDPEATAVSQIKASVQDDNYTNDLAFKMEQKPDDTLLPMDKLKAYCSASTSSMTAEARIEVEEVETACFD